MSNTEPKIKLLTWWMLDKQFHQDKDSHFLSCGIWETIGVQETNQGRVYEFRCILPSSDGVQVNDKRKMHEDVIIALCHQVEINHLPKLKK